MPTFEEILEAKQNEPDSVEDTESDDFNEPKGTSMDASTITVAGIIKDDNGHEWAIPADEVEDLDDFAATNPFHNLKYDPRFHYQIENINKVDQKLLEGFVVVTREEVGLPPSLNHEYGKPTTTAMQYLDGVLIKTPKVLAERKQAAKARLAKAVANSVEPSKESLDRAIRNKKRFKGDKSARDLTSGIESDGAEVKVTRHHRVSDKISM